MPLKYFITGLLLMFIAGTSVYSHASEKDISINVKKIKEEISVLKQEKQNALKENKWNKKIGAGLRRVLSGKTAFKKINGGLSKSDSQGKTLITDKVKVIFEVTGDVAEIANKIEAHGGKIIKKRKNLLAVKVDKNNIEDIINNVGGIEHARLPHKFFPFEMTTEGISITGAENFHLQGATGYGIKIAVIDFGFKGLSEAQASGDLPYNVITHDFTGSGLQTEYMHGTACAEIVHDIAPDSELHLLKVYGEIELYSVAEYCIDNNIDIVSLSLGMFGTGPGDGTGPIDEMFDEARANGILPVAAAGNMANYTISGMSFGSHWKGKYYDSTPFDPDYNFNMFNVFTFFEPKSYYNVISAIPYQDDDGNPETTEISIIMRWNDWPYASSDYDMYLFEYDYYSDEIINIYNPVTYSNLYQNGSQPPLEIIVLDIPDNEPYEHYYALVVDKYFDAVQNREIELFLGGTGQFVPFNEYTSAISTSSSSITEPADAQSVIAVGAINYADWETGPQESFSSQGPTNAWAGNAARIKPDICGPDRVSGNTYGVNAFAGTSAATPHIAGICALIKQVRPDWSPDLIQFFLESTAVDMGTVGKDNYYGSGRVQLTDVSILSPLDSDTDGLPDYIEDPACTDSSKTDTDGDGIPDGLEDANLNSIVDANETDPCKADTDTDGMPDGWK